MEGKAAAIIRLDLNNLKFSSVAFSYYGRENVGMKRKEKSGASVTCACEGPTNGHVCGALPELRAVST